MQKHQPIVMDIVLSVVWDLVRVHVVLLVVVPVIGIVLIAVVMDAPELVIMVVKMAVKQDVGEHVPFRQVCIKDFFGKYRAANEKGVG